MFIKCDVTANGRLIKSDVKKGNSLIIKGEE